MWNCTINGNASTSDYKGYAPIADNIISFLLGYERAPATYIDLIEENRALFIKATRCTRNLVEPRELLTVLNYVDVSDRLCWTPRPLRRSGSVEKDFIFYCPHDDTTACIFCGCKSRYVCRLTREDVVESRGQSQDNGQNSRRVGSQSEPCSRQDAAPVRLENYYYERLDPLYYVPYTANGQQQTTENNSNANNNNSSETEQQRIRISKSSQFHFQDCPLVWLEKNCQWQQKHSKWPTLHTSKFYYAVQILQYNSMKTEIEWNKFVERIVESKAMGACEVTLKRLFSKIINLKLRSVNVRQLDLFQNPLYAFHYNVPQQNYSGSTVVSDNCQQQSQQQQQQQQHCLHDAATSNCSILDYILCNSGVADLNIKRLSFNVPNFIYAIDTDRACKVLVMHGFCVEYKMKSSVNYFKASGAHYSYTPPHMYTIHTTLKVPSIEMVCVYCGEVFENKLCEPQLIEKVYSKHSQRIILEYLSYISAPISFPSQTTMYSCKWNYWERSPPSSMSSDNNIEYQVEEVLSSMELHERVKHKAQETPLSHHDKKLLWLSASINLAHSPLCIFRYQKPIYAADKCPVCMDDIDEHVSLFNCGHTMCITCVNDIRITKCPVCKMGTRKYRFWMHDNQEHYV